MGENTTTDCVIFFCVIPYLVTAALSVTIILQYEIIPHSWNVLRLCQELPLRADDDDDDARKVAVVWTVVKTK